MSTPTMMDILKRQRLMYPESDKYLFDSLTRFVPPWGLGGTVMHSSAASVQCFRLMGYVWNPQHVLEIGFNLGHGTILLLEVARASMVTSVDVNSSDQVAEAARLVADHYSGRHRLVSGDSKDPAVETTLGLVSKNICRFDVAYIDGDHSIEGVDNDVKLALRLGIKRIFFDDFHDEWGPGTIPAIENNELKIIAVQGNMCLCVTSEGYKLPPI